jgi:hypothetical protein
MTGALPTNRDIATARLPDNYVRAAAALRACARKFTPERYAKAVVALGDAWITDEVEAWPDKKQQLATYARLCDDDPTEDSIDSDLLNFGREYARK